MKEFKIKNLKFKITIGYLYGDLMNIYGDTGNITCLQKRAEWRGIEVKVVNISLKDHLPTSDVGTQIDLFFFGGGQDQAQELVAKNLQNSGKGEVIKREVERGVPLLSICGGYQLLGEYYQPHQGPKLEGIRVFPAYTVAGNKRMIGNVVISLQPTAYSSSSLTFDYTQVMVSGNRTMSDLGVEDLQLAVSNLIGFENHSGKTYLKNGGQPLGQVIKGFGNNGEDQTEGCIYKNAIGCYLHGSLLPKNPHLADWLLQKALEVKYGKEVVLEPLDDTIELQAHQKALQKFG